MHLALNTAPEWNFKPVFIELSDFWSGNECKFADIQLDLHIQASYFRKRVI